MSKICGVYRIYCAATDKSYIGSSRNILARWNSHRYRLRKKTKWNNPGLQADYDLNYTFEYEVLEKTTEEDLITRERYYMSLFPEDRIYNMQRFSDNGKQIPHPESVIKTTRANRGKTLSEEQRAKISYANKGRVHSDETRAKIGAGRKGKTHSDETLAKMSAVKKGKILSEEHRAKIGKASKGKTHSDAARLKISEAQKARWARRKEQ
jgi:group I intron endonuclease